MPSISSFATYPNNFDKIYHLNSNVSSDLHLQRLPQSLQLCGLNLENQCFSNGQLYVACLQVWKYLIYLCVDQTEEQKEQYVSKSTSINLKHKHFFHLVALQRLLDTCECVYITDFCIFHSIYYTPSKTVGVINILSLYPAIQSIFMRHFSFISLYF